MLNGNRKSINRKYVTEKEENANTLMPTYLFLYSFRLELHQVDQTGNGKLDLVGFFFFF